MAEILLCVNSDIGRGNTIGARFERVARTLREQGTPVDIIARANYTSDIPVTTPWYRNVLARGANALRIYSRRPNLLRLFELRQFDRFVLRFLQRSRHHYRVAHLGEYLPRTSAYLRQQGTRVLLDIPIAHPHAAQLLAEQAIPIGELSDTVIAQVDAAISLADMLIVPSRYVEETIEAAGVRVPRVVIPFGVDPRTDITEETITVKAHEPESPFTFLFAGAVNRRKGIPQLIAAWKQAELSNARLVICGRVYEEVRDLLTDAQSYGIVICGFTSLEQYFRNADVFVFPTLLEGSAKVVYEAMSYGLPVVTTSHAGSVIEHDASGYLVPVGDVHALTRAMQELYDEEERRERLGVAAWKTACRYTWQRYAKSVIELYH